MASVRSFDVLRCVCVCAHVCEAVMAYLSACHFFFQPLRLSVQLRLL